jgi:hypothetical protein
MGAFVRRCCQRGGTDLPWTLVQRPFLLKHTMTNTPDAKPNKRMAARAAARASTPNPYLDGDLYARMRDYTERDASIIKELKAIAESGAGGQSPDPRYAPSLATLLGLVKKGLTFADMLERIAAGTEKGLWAPWMEAFGFELRTVNYAATGARNATIALDLRAGSKTHALFAREGVHNWRSLVAQDCAKIQIQKATETSALQAFAVFVVDPSAG